jgi:hypothetical protein
MEWLSHFSDSLGLRGIGIGAVVGTLLSGIASLGFSYFAVRRAAEEQSRLATKLVSELKKIEQEIVKLDPQERRGVLDKITALREQMLRKETDEGRNELNQNR